MMKLSSKAESTQRTYTQMLGKFLNRWGYTHESLFETYHKLYLNKLTGGGDPRDADTVETQLTTQINEMLRDGYSASTALSLKNALTFFFKSQGLPFAVDSEDLPSKDSRGRDIPTRDQLKRMLKHCTGMYELRNSALIMFLKDSGLRVSDVEPLNVEDYLVAKETAAKMGYPGFAWFKDVHTKKRKIWAYPAVGPDAVEALDRYLAERDAEPGEPLFMGMRYDEKWGEVVGESRLSSDSMVSQMLNLGDKVDGKVSAHSMRAYHSTNLRGAGVPIEWIKRLQGKKLKSSDDPYYHPEQSDKLLASYVEAYDTLKIDEDPASSVMVESLKQQIESMQTQIAGLLVGVEPGDTPNPDQLKAISDIVKIMRKNGS